MKQWKHRTAALVMALLMALSLTTLASAADYQDMPGGWSKTAMESAVDSGLLYGSGGLVNPQGKVTRAELAAVIVRAFGAGAAADLSGFTDVPGSAWYYDTVAQAVQMGLMSGSGTSLAPGREVTRQEAFVVLARALNLDDGSAADLEQFSDAGSVSGWAVGPVAAMVKGGYVSGSGGALNPGRTITRAELAQVLYNSFAFIIQEAGVVTQIPEGNVVVNVPDVTLKGVTVTGDVVLGDGVGDGDARLEQVTVEGCVNVRGGGQNSVYFEDCVLVLVKVNKQFGEGIVPLRLVFLGSTSTTVRIEVISLNCNVLIEGVVGNIVIAGKYAYITVSGRAERVTVERGANGAVILNNGVIGTLYAGEDVRLEGGGRVDDIRGGGKVTDEDGREIRPSPSPEPDEPTVAPAPTSNPTEAPTAEPSPTFAPTAEPTAEPSPTSAPTAEPTAEPSPTQPVATECPHTNQETIPGKAATCTETGLTDGQKCTDCGTILKAQETIDALGHSVVTDAAVEPTCTETGMTAGSHCSVCNTILKAQETINALGHKAVTDAAVAATCTTAGKTEGSHCSVCNAVIIKQTDIPMVEHSYLVDTTEPGADMNCDSTCSVSCKDCGAQKVITAAEFYLSDLQNLIHAYDAGGVCTKCGYSKT